MKLFKLPSVGTLSQPLPQAFHEPAQEHQILSFGQSKSEAHAIR
jgi:hypothetical protein